MAYPAGSKKRTQKKPNYVLESNGVAENQQYQQLQYQQRLLLEQQQQQQQQQQYFQPKQFGYTSPTLGMVAPGVQMPSQNTAWPSLPSSPRSTESISPILGANPGVSAGAPVGGLSADYAKKVRPLIDLIDKFRQLGLDQDFGLPAIVVVGDQSAGKSSVLEAISGVQLPRGTGIVTRCPLQLCLKRNPSIPWAGRISYRDAEHKLQSYTEVEEAVRKAQDDLAGKQKGVTNELISLEIESPILPDLTLVDLPGITRVAVAGQDPGVAERIREMIQSYITKEETIILAVVPATSDIATVEALDLAMKVDKDGERTLGVITKTDMVERHAEGELISILLNERFKLRKGYIAVKCRGANALQENMTLESALEEEEMFFAQKDVFRDHQNLCGIKSLSKRLADELAQQIQKVLPGLEKKIRQKLEVTRRSVAGLGQGIPTDTAEKRCFLLKLIQEYNDDLKKLADGYDDEIDQSFRLHKGAAHNYEKFAISIQKLVPQRSGPGTNKLYSALIDDIAREMEADKGRELPDFIKFTTFKRIVWKIVHQFQDPAITCMHELASEIEKRLVMLTEKWFGAYPKLDYKIKHLVSRIIIKARDMCTERIEEMFKLEELVYSQQQTYLHSLRLVNENKHDKGAQPPPDRTRLMFDDIARFKQQEAELMFTRIQAYMEVCVIRVADIIPMIITQNIIMRVVGNLRNDANNLLMDEASVMALFKENPEEQNRRLILQKQLDRLQKAEAELQKSSTYIF